MPRTAMLTNREVRRESRQVSRFSGRRVHFIGVGGCGMSGLARMLLDAGAVVSGTDPKPNAQTLQLAAHGARITREQDGSALSADVDLVVRTAAIPESNAEYQAALRLNLAQVKYAQLLGQVMQERLGVAISGTHGKSTTTAMTSFALLECGADPSFVIGGTVRQLGGSSRSGLGDAFVVEACEFDRSFHNLHPRVAVITNIEADHLDCYRGGLREIIESFRAFARLAPVNGRIIANGQDRNVREALEGLETPVEWVGIEETPTLTWSARVTGVDRGCFRADVFYNGMKVTELRLGVAGRHNLFDSMMAVAACHACGVAPREAAEALGRFQGVDRRMAELGQYNGAVVVDDYGHHPTEIRTTLRAVREKYAPQRMICVFQPHQYSRTRFLLEEFATSFSDADLTIVPDIYAARDSAADRESVSTADLVRRIEAAGSKAMHIAQLPQIVAHLRQILRTGDLVIVMGAGNVCDVGRELVEG